MGSAPMADKAEGICSTFLGPFKQHGGPQTARLWVTANVQLSSSSPAPQLQWSHTLQCKSSPPTGCASAPVTTPPCPVLSDDNCFPVICEGAPSVPPPGVQSRVSSPRSISDMSVIIALTCEITTDTAVFTARFVKLRGIWVTGLKTRPGSS